MNLGVYRFWSEGKGGHGFEDFSANNHNAELNVIFFSFKPAWLRHWNFCMYLSLFLVIDFSVEIYMGDNL